MPDRADALSTVFSPEFEAFLSPPDYIAATKYEELTNRKTFKPIGNIDERLTPNFEKSDARNERIF